MSSLRKHQTVTLPLDAKTSFGPRSSSCSMAAGLLGVGDEFREWSQDYIPVAVAHWEPRCRPGLTGRSAFSVPMRVSR